MGPSGVSTSITPWALLTSACGNLARRPALTPAPAARLSCVKLPVIAGGAGVPSNAPMPAAIATPAPAKAATATAITSTPLQEPSAEREDAPTLAICSNEHSSRRHRPCGESSRRARQPWPGTRGEAVGRPSSPSSLHRLRVFCLYLPDHVQTVPKMLRSPTEPRLHRSEWKRQRLRNLGVAQVGPGVEKQNLTLLLSGSASAAANVARCVRASSRSSVSSSWATGSTPVRA
jgi:hypothetical protein